MKFSSIPSAQSIVQHCKSKGINTIVISPGSRNAPLIIGFTEDPYFNCFSIVDERCAAFFALGIAQQSHLPVALVCTSGSAVLNYYPAIAEAFYSNIPLVVISADRPGYKIDIGDGQTIRQANVFGDHVAYSANLKQDVTHATEKVLKYDAKLVGDQTVGKAQIEVQHFNDRTLDAALGIALQSKLPVHINVPLEEPLYRTVEAANIGPVPLLPQVFDKIELEDISEFVRLWQGSAKKMVLIGVNPPDFIENRYLDILGNDTSVLVFTETTSNVHHPNFFSSIDSIVAPIEKSVHKNELAHKLRPSILLTFGGQVVSKKIKAFLRDNKPDHHWHVDPLRALDTYFALTRHFKMGVNQFLETLLMPGQNVSSHYFGFWQGLKAAYTLKRGQYLNQIPFSDLKAFSTICKNIPLRYNLHLANSSTVRYTQLFDIDPTVKVYCNRGTSGIDGSTSTAMGAAQFAKNPTLLITGDLGFLYDSNAFWHKYIKKDFKIILINNEGGGIFRILPGHEDSDNFKTYFETVQNLDISHLCKMYDIDYKRVDTDDLLEKSLTVFFQQKTGAALIEVRTPRILNDKILLGYFDFIS